MRILTLLSVWFSLNQAPRALASEPRAPTTYNTRFPGVSWDNDAWTLTSTSAQNAEWHAQSFVANGYIGSSFTSTGPFPYVYNVSEGPYFNEHLTFGTAAGFFDRQPNTTFANSPWLWQYGWESSISGLPAWGSLVLDLGGDAYLDGSVDQAELSSIVLKQDFKKGYASYAYTWTPTGKDGLAIDILYTVFADKARPNRAYVQMQATANRQVNATVANIIDGMTALRTDFEDKGADEGSIYSAVKPNGVNDTAAWVYSALSDSGMESNMLRNLTGRPYISQNASTIAQGVDIQLEAQKKLQVTKYVSIASTDTYEDARETARKELSQAMSDGYDQAFQRHAQEWERTLPRSSVTSFADPSTGMLPGHLVERQIATVVAAAMLLMNSVGEAALEYADGASINSYGFGVCGLLSDCYGGQRYWDMDTWMGPYVFASHPFEAKQIALSRTAFYEQSLENIHTAYQGSKRNFSFSTDAAVYAWSTGRDGNCTGFAPCFDYEYHINGDIFQGFVSYWAASGDDEFFESSLLPITNSVATLYSDLLQLDKESGTYVLTNVSDPDEYAASVDNGAYTNALVRYTLEAANYFSSLFGQPTNDFWDEQAKAVNIPYNQSADLTLEYTGMNDSILIKQADVVMITYPLNNPINATTANQLSNLNYYASKQDPDGPAMTYAIYSIDSSVLEPSGCAAYTYDLYSWSPYVHGPWFTFDEVMNEGTGAYPFLTGHGGFLQVDLFGYLGLRYGPAFELQIYPRLPPQIPYIRFPTFYFQGWPILAEANQTHTTLKREGSPLETANSTFGEQDITFRIGRDATESKATLQLPPDGTLVVPNAPAVALDERNIVQCKPVVDGTTGNVPGQFPHGALDGSNSTVWQPLEGAMSSNLTVDLGTRSPKQVGSIWINWGGNPASGAYLYFSNSTGNATTEPESHRIDVLGGGSTSQGVTILTLADEDVWTARYATLTIEGDGWTIAEWGIHEL